MTTSSHSTVPPQGTDMPEDRFADITYLSGTSEFLVTCPECLNEWVEDRIPVIGRPHLKEVEHDVYTECPQCLEPIFYTAMIYEPDM